MPDNVFDNTAEPAKDKETTTDKTTTDTVDGLNKRLADKDEFIEKLKGETSTMRTELEGRDKGLAELDNLREELKRLKQEAITQPKDTTISSSTDLDIEKLVANAITKREQESTVAQNVKSAIGDATKLFGSFDEAKKAQDAASERTGLSLSELGGIAGRSPTAFAALLGAPAVPGDSKTVNTTSTVNSEALNLGGAGGPKQGTKAYFDAIRREKGMSFYMKPAIQNQIVAAARAGTYFVGDAA